jgi:hypothetical protein
MRYPMPRRSPKEESPVQGRLGAVESQPVVYEQVS